jgi:hypothetical protein
MQAVDQSKRTAHLPVLPIVNNSPGFTVAEVLRMTGVSDTTLLRHAKQVGVPTPGKKNRHFTEDQLRTLLGQIAANCRCRATRDRCCGLLADCKSCPLAHRLIDDRVCWI